MLRGWVFPGNQLRVLIKAEKVDGKLKMIADPRKPSDREVEDHNRMHMPYRNWCPLCVAGRGKGHMHHDREDHEGDRGAEVNVDYAFLRNCEGDTKATVLVSRCRNIKMLLAHVVPSNGGE